MTLTFTVQDLPPKKDGANSMWRKGTELARLKALRLAAVEAMRGQPPLSGFLSLELILFSKPADGDLDNFITGVCDGLMAAHPATPIDHSAWADLPPAARPTEAIAFRDDVAVSSIVAKRVPITTSAPSYTLIITPNANAVSA